MESKVFSINSTYENIVVNHYISLEDEEKYRYCDLEALGNLIIDEGNKATDYGKMLNVFIINTFLSTWRF